MQSAEQAAAAAASAEGQESSLVRAPVKHVLSQELQLYFERVAQLLRAKPGNALGQGKREVSCFGCYCTGIQRNLSLTYQASLSNLTAASFALVC